MSNLPDQPTPAEPEPISHRFKARLIEIGDNAAAGGFRTGAGFNMSDLYAPPGDPHFTVPLPVEQLRRLGAHLQEEFEVEVILRPVGSSGGAPE